MTTGASSTAAAIILAAGASTRMGAPKALARYAGQTFLEGLIAVYAPLCQPIIVVLGYEAERIQAGCRIEPARAVLNPHPERGQFSSLQCGLRALPPDCAAAFFQPVDAPGIGAETLAALRAATSAQAAIPIYQGRRGHPVLIGRKVMEGMLAAPFDASAKALLALYESETAWVPVADPAVLRDIDDPAALEAMEK